jgi:diguanylate cyclase (GGDEF)-like protein
MKPTRDEHIAELVTPIELDLRILAALAGDRSLNAREESIMARLQAERGEKLYADMLYALTHRAFPSKQAKHLWEEILDHRRMLNKALNRDVGISVAAHDYMVNQAHLLQNPVLVEKGKLESLASIATRDGLTGLFDHASFQHKLRDEIERQTRYGNHLSLILIDLDNFKAVNDTYGHGEGDLVLKRVADLMLAHTRRLDTAARYGGEEFVLVLPEADGKAAAAFAERLRVSIADAFATSPYKVTASIGVATRNKDNEVAADTLLEQADRRMYAAKRSGKNRVVAVDQVKDNLFD